MDPEAQTEALLAALRRIARIKNRYDGGDWEEIDEARAIARGVLDEVTGEAIPDDPWPEE